MKVGVMATNYNPGDWDRLLAGDYSRPPAKPDPEIVANTIEFGSLIEPLGFDSLWTTEHWGSAYAMQTDPLQWLSFWAGRTEKVDMGTAVLVLPWWDPVRLAHQVSMLDILLQGRRFIPGVGRGVAPHEYGSFRIPTDDSRERFHEVLDVLRLADSSPEAFSYSGKIFNIPLTSVRPQPIHKGHLFDEVWGAFGTSTSARMGAKVGLNQIFTAGENLDEMTRKAMSHNQGRIEAGFEPTRSIAMLFTRCLAKPEPDADRYYNAQRRGTHAHYALWKNPGFENIKGYEEYSRAFAHNEAQAAADTFSGGSQRAHQLIGTPDQLIEKIRMVKDAISMEHLVLHINHGGAPLEDARASLELFAKEVLPVVQKMDVPPPRVKEPAAAQAPRRD